MMAVFLLCTQVCICKGRHVIFNVVHVGTLYVQMGRLGDAESYLRHALKLNPNHHGAVNNLRVVEHQRKSQEKPPR